MIITAIRLHNIKSFVDEELQFARGINIIAGRNGSGKSTIIEAVGLALFDAWPQRFKDGNARSGFLRNGTKEGSIEIDVLRGGASFTVHCDLAQRRRAGKDSIDYERQLFGGQRAEIAKSAGRKKEFQDDIRRELLGESRIDDDKLFRDIIGTEQGTFDEPFTRNESERKELFEKILGISDFQDFEKQFYHLVKWQAGQSKELAIRLQERAGVPEEVLDAEALLKDRDDLVKEAAAAMKIVTERVTTARTLVDGMTARRDDLQKAQAERQRLQEKLKGDDAVIASAKNLLDEASKAAAALEAARAGHTSFVSAEMALEALRKTAKDRDVLSKTFANERTAFETRSASLTAQAESLQKEHALLLGEIETAENSVKGSATRIEQLREAWKELDAARSALDERAKLAGELRSYVQDLRSTRDALQNAGESMRLLHETFTALALRLDEKKLEADFLPELREETEALFERHPAEKVQTEEDDALARMFTESKSIESQLVKESREAADLTSRKAEEGKSESKQLTVRKSEKQKYVDREAKCKGELADVQAKLSNDSEAWKLRSAGLTGALDAHGDLDAAITENEGLLETHRAAHTAFLAQQGAAETLATRQKSHDDAEEAAKTTRGKYADAEKLVNTLADSFSEEEFGKAKAALELDLSAEKAAVAGLGGVKARLEEQQAAVKKLRKEHREYEKLRSQTARAKAETAFSSDVHQHVVRELARRVGASIVEALSGFAGELYTRIAPEQDLALHWDPQTYAVELRSAQGSVRGRELSGGQLMGVSLAVKLALIKWYSECRIGFLDEPTTHLDKETRRHLADVIQNLEQLTGDADPWFDQLFVISHEESFSGAGHRIELELHQEEGSRVREIE